MPPSVSIGEIPDLAAQYRSHADCVSNGERPTPTRALLIEVDNTGIPCVYTCGMHDAPARELVGVLADGIEALAGAVTAANAGAGH